MNKSFPVLKSVSGPRRYVGLASTLVTALALGGCATYYPDSYPSSGPYYGGGGVGAVYSDRYYDPYYSGGYYGYPAYNSTTIYYDSFRPGYAYRPGYGYYYPAPPPRGGHDHGHDHDRDRGRGWGDVAREAGSNQNRDDRDRGSSWGSPRGNQGNAKPRPNLPSPPSDSGRSNGWLGRVTGGNDSRPSAPPPPRPQISSPPRQDSAPRPSAPPPRPSSDSGSRSRGGWGDKVRNNRDR